MKCTRSNVWAAFLFLFADHVLYELPIFVFGILGISHYGCCDNKKIKILTYFLIYWIIVDILYLVSKTYPGSSPFFLYLISLFNYRFLTIVDLCDLDRIEVKTSFCCFPDILGID